jgi:hypothetical protein
LSEISLTIVVDWRKAAIFPGVHGVNPSRSECKESSRAPNNSQRRFFFDKEAFQHREKPLAVPLKERPAQQLQGYGGPALSQADWAARLNVTGAPGRRAAGSVPIPVGLATSRLDPTRAAATGLRDCYPHFRRRFPWTHRSPV